MAARIFIVDDHDVVRHGVRSIISRGRPNWEICGEAANGEEALKAIERLAPDVVILDVTMPVMNGLEATPRIVQLATSCRILILTMHDSQRLSAEVQRAGAHGYVEKSRAGHDLIQAIDCLLAGGTFFGPQAEVEAKLEAKTEAKDDPKRGTFSLRLILG